MQDKKNISVYVRNKDITPSSYYRIIQYVNFLDGNVVVRDIAPKKLYEKHMNTDKKNKLSYLVLGFIYYIVMLSRVTYFLLIDLINKPQHVIVSKLFCPRYTPVFLEFLIKKVSQRSSLYWDFDDNIFERNEISKKEKIILELNSKAIVVTSDFLKSKINSVYHNKVVLLPTTDGDLQGFDEELLREKRKATYFNKIKIVWVATAANMPNLENIIGVLDETAKILKETTQKQLELIVVCNKPLVYSTENLKITNIKWTREAAKEQIYDSHIGIMPLIYGEYALGKGGFKLVQYMSTALPVIASNVGFNDQVVKNNSGILVNDIKSNEGWIQAVLNLSKSYEKWTLYSNNAYKRWNESFSFEQNLKTWNDLLNEGE
ncbi:glycosyltransferase [Rossellomorea aquimaris]|nr:glycosyltransferase [Rossellomorea aquimaris]WRP06319.1 glycosyltransferase [Rossellomorea aquimaris]